MKQPILVIKHSMECPGCKKQIRIFGQSNKLPNRMVFGIHFDGKKLCPLSHEYAITL